MRAIDQRWARGCRSALLLAIAACAVSHAQQPVEVTGIVSELRASHFQQAVSLADQALKAHPANCQVLSLKGVAYGSLGEPAEALQSFDAALKTCPRYLPALEGAAQISYAQHAQQAIPLLRRILAIEPGDVPGNAMLATALSGENKCGEALANFAAARPAFPARPALQANYARCLASEGKDADALVEMQALADTAPDDVTLYNVAVLRWKLKQGREALAALEAVLARREFVPAFTLAARIAEELGDTPRAVELARTAIVLAPDDVQGYVDFANLSFAHSSFQVGVDMLNVGIHRLPTAASLYLARGVLEAQLSQPEQAVADFERAHTLDPALTLTEDALGIVKTQQQANGAALETFRKQVETHPDDPILQYLLAEQLTSQGDAADPAAIAACKRAVLLDPKYLPAHDLLAKLYVRSGDAKAAVGQAEAALAQDPDDQEALYQEMMASRRLGDRARTAELSRRFNEARQKNVAKQAAIDRYRLVEGPAQP